MGKIESGEIGEVDPLPDSSNSLALIRYARQAVSSHSPQHTERGRSPERGQSKPICSSVCPAPSSGHPQGISTDFVLFCFLPLFVSQAFFPPGRESLKGNAFWELHKQRCMKSCATVYDSED